MTERNFDINFLTAGDRNNYGDFLFAIIAKKKLGKHCSEFRNYGVVKSNFKAYGALPTYSFRKLQKDIEYSSKDQLLIIGGGEVFFVSWTDLYRFINKSFNKLMTYYKLKSIENKFKFSKRILSKNNVHYPYTPGVKDFKNLRVKIVYNAVGGIFKESINSPSSKLLINNLKQATYISVRDVGTQNSLKRAGINSKLVPDSALLISDIFTKDYLSNLNPELKNIYKKKYLFFQISKSHKPKTLNIISQKLKELSHRLDLKVILSPIGLAEGHEDDVALKELLLLDNEFVYVQPNSLFDIMGLIAHAKVFIGTSLHGAITAQSYCVPFLRFSRIRKVDAFYKTWHGDLKDTCFSEDKLDEISREIINWDYANLQKKNSDQKDLIFKNFELIKNLNKIA